MSTSAHLPIEAERYLRRLRAALRGVDEEERDAILDELRSHLADRWQEGPEAVERERDRAHVSENDHRERRSSGMARGVWSTVWRIGLFLVVWGLLLAPSAFLIPSGDGPSTGLPRDLRFVLELYGLASILVAAWLATRFFDRRPFLTLGFRPGGIGRDVAVGLILGAALIVGALGLAALGGWVTILPVAEVSWAALGLIGGAMLFNSGTQEVLVRGYLLQTLDDAFGERAALVGSSVAFMGLHAGALVEAGALAAINLFAAGLLLGLAYTTTRELWLPIALHFSWNFVQGPILGVSVSGQALDAGWQLVELTGPPAATGGAFGLEGGLVGTAAIIVGIVTLVTADRRGWLRWD